MAPEVFVSYSRKDLEKAKAFVELLRSAGVSVWIDKEGIGVAHPWGQEIVEAIEKCTVLISMLSRSSVASHNVVKELALAWECKKHILPLYIEPVEVPKTMRYPLAGIQHIELFHGDSNENFQDILRSLARLGVKVEKPDAIGSLAALAQEKNHMEKATIPGESKPEPFSTFSNPVGMEFILIPAGNFKMGSSDNEEENVSGFSHSMPQHIVAISNLFYIQTTQLTQRQWKLLMGNNPSYFKGCGEDCPVEKVSWNDTQKFIRRLNELERTEKYRLPTEAEWEYACRAGTETGYSWGDEIYCSRANYGSGLSKECEPENPGRPMRVGSFPPNPWGLYDMHGNVWEWCQDWYASGYYSNSPARDPKGPSFGEYRVLRGGSWGSRAGALLSASRYRSRPGSRDGFFGFRVVRDF